MQKMILFTLLCTALTACAQKKTNNSKKTNTMTDHTVPTTPLPKLQPNVQVITLGAGCFWCVEAVFQSLKGVTKVESGYSGGAVPNPSYEQICTKTTGHAEVCNVYYDTTILKLPELLEVYWLTHDPTTLNRQGADAGPQYRSVIYYNTEEQKQVCTSIMQNLDKSGAWPNPIITAIEPFTNFYVAEEYHQNYYKNNPNQGYCTYVIRPKMEKFYKVFKDKAVQ